MIESNTTVVEEVQYSTTLKTVTNDIAVAGHIMQNRTKFKYALVDSNYKTLNIPVYCKDFFNDVIATQIDGVERKIYGFKINKFDFDLLDQEEFTLALFAEQNDLFTKDSLDNILLLINEAEENRGFTPTTLEYTTDNKVVVLHSDIRWMSKPVYFSFYTAMLRVGYSYNEEWLSKSFEDFIKYFHTLDSKFKINSSESYSWKDKEDYLAYLFNGGEVLQTWEDVIGLPIHELHNYSGLINYYNLKCKNNLDQLKNDVKNKNTIKVPSDDSIEASNTQPVACEEQIVTT